jgi:L-threonylcarbamoyladenylate synthase
LLNTQIIEDTCVAAQALQSGLLVAFPTETVFGLGADATNPQAIARLFKAKGRPSDNPLIVHLGGIDHLSLATDKVTESAQVLLERFSPGPLTVVVPKHTSLASAVTAGLDTVGIRIPNHPLALELLQRCNRPIAAPSANRSGRPSCTTWQAVWEDMQDRVDYILRGDSCQIGIESTVVDCSGSQPVQLRAGAITLEQLRQVVPDIKTWNQLELADDQALPSPGLRHAHYQPVAPVYLFNYHQQVIDLPGGQLAQSACADLRIARSPSESYGQPLTERCLLYQSFYSIADYMRGFYEFLREADRRGAARIYLQIAPANDQGAALRDRQIRAAGRTN